MDVRARGVQVAVVKDEMVLGRGRGRRKSREETNEEEVDREETETAV